MSQSVYPSVSQLFITLSLTRYSCTFPRYVCLFDLCILVVVVFSDESVVLSAELNFWKSYMKTKRKEIVIIIIIIVFMSFHWKQQKRVVEKTFRSKKKKKYVKNVSLLLEIKCDGSEWELQKTSAWELVSALEQRKSSVWEKVLFPLSTMDDRLFPQMFYCQAMSKGCWIFSSPIKSCSRE